MSFRLTTTDTRALSARARLAPVLAIAMALVSACADAAPTAPALSEQVLRPRRTEYRCVAPSPDGDDVVVMPVPADGTCPAGFDMMPWT